MHTAANFMDIEETHLLFFLLFFAFFFHFVCASTTMCTRHTRTRSRRPLEAIPVAPRRRFRRLATVALGYGITLFAFFSFFCVFLYFVRASTTMCTCHTRARSRRPQEAIPVAPRRCLGGWRLWPWDKESHFLRFFRCFCVFFNFVRASTTMCTRHTSTRSRRPPGGSRWRPEGVLEGGNCGPGARNHTFCVFSFFSRKRGNVYSPH